MNTAQKVLLQIIVILLALGLTLSSILSIWNTYVYMRDQIATYQHQLLQVAALPVGNRSTSCLCSCVRVADSPVIRCSESLETSDLCNQLNSLPPFNPTAAGYCDVYSMCTNDFPDALDAVGDTANCTFSYDYAISLTQIGLLDNLRIALLVFDVLATAFVLLVAVPSKVLDIRAKLATLGKAQVALKRIATSKKLDLSNISIDLGLKEAEDSKASIIARTERQKRAQAAVILLEDDDYEVNSPTVVMPFNASSSVIPSDDAIFESVKNVEQLQSGGAVVTEEDNTEEDEVWYADMKLLMLPHIIRDIPELILITLFTSWSLGRSGVDCHLCVAAGEGVCSANTDILADQAVALAIGGVVAAVWATTTDALMSAEIWASWRRLTLLKDAVKGIARIIWFAALFMWMWFIAFVGTTILAQGVREMVFPNLFGLIVASIACLLVPAYWIVFFIRKHFMGAYEEVSYFEGLFFLNILRNAECTKLISSLKEARKYNDGTTLRDVLKGTCGCCCG